MKIMKGNGHWFKEKRTRNKMSISTGDLLFVDLLYIRLWPEVPFLILESLPTLQYISCTLSHDFCTLFRH